MTAQAALLWFKSDPRVRDHAPLAEAAHFDSALGLAVIEPQWLGSPECDPRHVAYLMDCVAELRRDLAVAEWCRSQGVQWTESPQTGVVRRLRSRTGWAGYWAQRMNAPEAQPARGFKAAPGRQPSLLPTLCELGVPTPRAALPPGGERAAWDLLDSFLAGRGRDYRRALSSPLTATEGCSRPSAHLAFGTISMRCAHQDTEARISCSKSFHHSSMTR